MNEITRWFESIGVPPLLGGMAIGAIIVFLVTRKSASTSNGFPNTERKIGNPIMAAGSTVQIRIENDGKSIELSREQSAEISEQLRNGNKIAAIKALRESTGLGLAEAKGIVDAIERSGTKN